MYVTLNLNKIRLHNAFHAVNLWTILSILIVEYHEKPDMIIYTVAPLREMEVFSIAGLVDQLLRK